MKKRNLMGLVAASSFMAMCGSAMAADGTITFNGALTDTTCTITLNGGGSPNGTVTMPTIPASSLGGAGSWAGPTSFFITLTGCSGGTLNTAKAWFENTGAVDTTTGRLNNTASGPGSATGVQIELTDASLVPIFAGGTTTTMGGPSVNITSGNGTLNYIARYYATATATSGQVISQVQYSIVYQ